MMPSWTCTACRLCLIALAAVGAATCVPGLDDDGSGDPPLTTPGAIDLALTMAPGIEVGTVGYEIKGNGIAPRSGSIDVTDPRATISVVVGALPAGAGYQVTLSATTADKRTTCKGTAPFSIVAGRSSAVRVDLDCGDVKAPSSTGSVTVVGNRCPTLGALTASPTRVSPGGIVTLLASAFDLDPGDTLSYQWTGGAGGTFADPKSANTTFRYGQAGNTTITLTVSDGHCGKSKEIAISCGGGITGAGGDGGPGR
jgi:hypothetical protein